jgi:four helix bundle protein
MQNYKELDVWQKVVRLATDLYTVTGRFPDTEKYGLVAQIRRAATSVPANIAEGWGRGSTKEYIQFLMVARGSLMELETHLIIAGKLRFLDNDLLEQILKQIEDIGKMLNRLVSSLRSRGEAAVARTPKP